MSFGRRNLRLRFVRGYAIPLYLSREHIPLLREVIQVYEDKVGEPLYKLDQDLIRYIIGDDRLAKGLVHAMRYFYGPEELGELKLSSRKRIQVFRLVNKLYKGFVPSDERDSFIVQKSYGPMRSRRDGCVRSGAVIHLTYSRCITTRSSIPYSPTPVRPKLSTRKGPIA